MSQVSKKPPPLAYREAEADKESLEQPQPKDGSRVTATRWTPTKQLPGGPPGFGR